MSFAQLAGNPVVAPQSAPAPGSVLANLDRIRMRVDSYLVPEDPQDFVETDCCQ